MPAGAIVLPLAGAALGQPPDPTWGAGCGAVAWGACGDDPAGGKSEAEADAPVGSIGD